MTELRKELESILLSDEFIRKLAAAIANAPMPESSSLGKIDWSQVTYATSIASQIEHGTAEPR